MIDLRSDTVTRPTPEMREAMAGADVGDDVLGHDPTVDELEGFTAQLLGKERALFVPSGTMANQLAIGCATEPGDEILVVRGAHPIWYEVGAASALSGVQLTECGDAPIMTAGDLTRLAKAPSLSSPATRLAWIENTHNRAGGKIVLPAAIEAVARCARELGLGLHLDGARLWNAAAGLGVSVKALAEPFDTVSVCFSKGLGAPVGSALAGPAKIIDRARRLRKRWGGAMRQAGIIAAGALFALRHHRARVSEDHRRAALLAERLSGARGIQVDPKEVETNIVRIDLDGPFDAAHVSREAHARGLAILPASPGTLRAVTHLDVDDDAIERAASILREIAGAG